jgi:hypothetical protein|tara:strand:+ start:923 stop:1063 length:141 start_codon:yes stop_codon:yes gene_type:complete
MSIYKGNLKGKEAPNQMNNLQQGRKAAPEYLLLALDKEQKTNHKFL